MTFLSKNIIFFSFFFFAFSCSQTPSKSTISPAFYHWKSELSLQSSEINYLKTLKTTKLYLRFFDVKWDPVEKIAVPVSVVNIDTSRLRGLEIIPVVFITNRTMREIKPADCAVLADNLISKIKTIYVRLPQPKIAAIQIDCDWTKSTRVNYFNFLKLLQPKLEKQNITLSTTLRLHQFRHPEQTGIPPVDRVMLMFYNMGEVNDYNETNSILNLETAASYLNTKKRYPLPLDFALPIFRWGCIFRDQKLVHLSNGLDENMLHDTSRFTKTGSNHFKVMKSTYLKGYFLYEGDEIRLESVSYDLLARSVDLLQKVKNTDEFSVAFYHLDTFNLRQYRPEQLNNLLLKLE